MGYSIIAENLKKFSGSGLLVILFLASVAFLFFRLKERSARTMLVYLPIFALLVYFCPVWIVYINHRSDHEILYRILWIIPMAIIIAYALVELIFMINKSKRPAAFIAAVLLIVVSGQYVYANPQFHKAENPYHVPQTIVDICDEIIIPGREIRACFPSEMIQYVRQYTAYVCQAYGRDTLLWGPDFDLYSEVAPLLDDEVLDTKALTEELRKSDTAYLILKEGRVCSEDVTNFEFNPVKTIDGYVLYLDAHAYLGLWDE